MWTPISINRFVKLYLKKNSNENEKVLRVRIEAALEDYKNGVKCKCGKDIWIVGSVSAPIACFTCITGNPHPRGDMRLTQPWIREISWDEDTLTRWITDTSLAYLMMTVTK